MPNKVDIVVTNISVGTYEARSYLEIAGKR